VHIKIFEIEDKSRVKYKALCKLIFVLCKRVSVNKRKKENSVHVSA